MTQRKTGLCLSLGVERGAYVMSKDDIQRFTKKPDVKQAHFKKLLLIFQADMVNMEDFKRTI
jgi:hypothetical protein